MAVERYTAQISGFAIAQDAPYALLLENLARFMVQAAVAHSADESRWDQEDLRLHGLYGLEVFRNGKALWHDRETFDIESAQAHDQRAAAEFAQRNELDTALWERLDHDLRRLLQQAGYDVPSLARTMKPFFAQINDDLEASASDERRTLIEEIVSAMR